MNENNFTLSAIKKASKLKNKVQAYYTDSRKNYIIKNHNITLGYALKRDQDQLVSFIKNTKGKSYIENTMDAFATLNDGTTVYASKTSINTTSNIFRYGYYYYEVRLEEQNFSNGIEILEEKAVSLEIRGANHISEIEKSGGHLKAKISNKEDPFIVFDNIDYPAEKYPYVQITVKTEKEAAKSGMFFVVAGGEEHFSYLHNVGFELISDGEYHTYTVCLRDISTYTGTVTGLRFDLEGAESDKYFEISKVTLLNAIDTGIPTLSAARIFHTYSDKLHHVLQVAAHKKTENIAAIGMRTEIAADTVDKLIVKDNKGLHDTLDTIDWSSSEYVGFDIKETGIFGYILPNDDTSGKMTVALEDGKYIIIQSRTPENFTILTGEGSPRTAPTPFGSEASINGKEGDAERTISLGNQNDFFMGQRIYTDEFHSFDEFIKEAEIEREPLTENNIIVDKENSDEGRFEGYDALRGCYKFHIKGSDFNKAYYKTPNDHPTLNITLKGDCHSRNIYITAATEAGALESAALLDENSMMLPIPIQVSKNFCGDGEDNIYTLLDTAYGEAIFPICIKDGDLQKLTVLHLYQNWGNFPLKQLSSIQYHAPYYHLSTGVTETNCLVPWRHTKDDRIQNVLPDHRPMSAPMWKSQPQHTSGGTHTFLRYLDSKGNENRSEVYEQMIDSYGPTYADVEMKHLSTDGKIKVSYTHVEMPQTDENRAYCTMSYEFIEDIDFKDFKTEFGFYNVGKSTHLGSYQQVGYLDINNKPAIVDANDSKSPIIYTMGDKCPYFSFFNMSSFSGKVFDYVNLSLLIYNSEFVIGGKSCSPRFAVRSVGGRLHLTLDLEKVSFKKGDSIRINAIIMPWGSYISDYNSPDFAPDQNVRDVRENSLLDPLKATAIANCDVINTPFIPKVKTVDGKSAEFTLSGGENNVVIRAYGFDTLTVPKVYEMVDGEWKNYELSSKDSPDISGISHNYDGYNVFYDADGKYSYSFIVKMNGGRSRRFKIEVI